jgi:hypothetical protein
MTTEVKTSATLAVTPTPARRGRKPGSKNKPKVVKAKRKYGPRTGMPRTARAYMRRRFGVDHSTEASAVADLIKRIETVEPTAGVQLSSVRQFMVNMFAGQPVKVSPL